MPSAATAGQSPRRGHFARINSATGSTHEKSDAPAQDRERDRIGGGDEIARHRKPGGAEAHRDDRDQYAEPLAQRALLPRTGAILTGGTA